MKKAALSTRNRKDGAFVGDEEAAGDGMASRQSEREETQPAAPGDVLRLEEDTGTSSIQEQTAANVRKPPL